MFPVISLPRHVMSCTLKEKYFPLTQESILCRVGKSAGSGMTINCLTRDSFSTDEGIETALSCCDSHETPLMSGFVTEKADARSEGGSGYDVPRQASLRSKARPAGVVVGGGGGRESAGGQRETASTQSGDEAAARDSSPPPTYSQLFCNSTTITTDPTTSSTCDPVKGICTHNQLHVATEHDERSGERDEEEGGCLSPYYASIHPPFFRPMDGHTHNSRTTLPVL